jgi:8-oxo-dGTP pyrophosphatase MutT (NUDIX family)
MSEQKTGAGTIFLSAKTGRVLFNLRSPHKTHRNQWSLWGGMVEGDETPKDCLLREIEEEVGFVPEISKIYPFDIYESRDKHFRYYTFVCVVQDEFVPQINHEAVGYCWVKLGEWPSPLHQGARSSFGTQKALALLEIILGQHR